MSFQFTRGSPGRSFGAEMTSLLLDQPINRISTSLKHRLLPALLRMALNTMQRIRVLNQGSYV
jgi:hypothetical protein